MKTSSKLNFKSIVGKIMMMLVLVTMIGSIDVTPALGEDNHKRMGKYDNGRYEHRGRGYDCDRYVYNRRVYDSSPGTVLGTSPVPEPASMFLLGSGLAGLLGLRKRFRNS